MHMHGLRCYAIKFPLRARSVCTNSLAKKSVVLAWILALLLALPVLYVQVRAATHATTFPDTFD